MVHPFGLFALFMPVVVVGLVVLVGWLLRRHAPRGVFLFAPLLVLGLPLADHAYSRAEFHKACRLAGPALILERTQADGFLLVSDSAIDFGARFLDQGFRWIERKSRDGGWERVSQQPDGSVNGRPVRQPTARYTLVEKVERSRSWTLVSATVLQSGTGDLLASAAHVLYNGGTLTWMLSPFAGAACPAADRPGVWGEAGVRMLPVHTLQPAGLDPRPKS